MPLSKVTASRVGGTIRMSPASTHHQPRILPLISPFLVVFYLKGKRIFFFFFFFAPIKKIIKKISYNGLLEIQFPLDSQVDIPRIVNTSIPIIIND